MAAPPRSPDLVAQGDGHARAPNRSNVARCSGCRSTIHRLRRMSARPPRTRTSPQRPSIVAGAFQTTTFPMARRVHRAWRLLQCALLETRRRAPAADGSSLRPLDQLDELRSPEAPGAAAPRLLHQMKLVSIARRPRLGARATSARARRCSTRRWAMTSLKVIRHRRAARFATGGSARYRAPGMSARLSKPYPEFTFTRRRQPRDHGVARRRPDGPRRCVVESVLNLSATCSPRPRRRQACTRAEYAQILLDRPSAPSSSRFSRRRVHHRQPGQGPAWVRATRSRPRPSVALTASPPGARAWSPSSKELLLCRAADRHAARSQ